MKKILIIIIIILGLGFYFWRYKTGSVDVPLENLEKEIVIPKNAQLVNLTRGDYVHSLKKVKNFDKSDFIVELTDVFRSDKNGLAIEDAYCASFSLVPMDDEKAVKALSMFKGGNSFDVEVSGSSEANNIMEDMNHLNEVTRNMAILPANSNVREAAKKVKKGDKIRVKGTQFKHFKVKQKGVEQELGKCLKDNDVLYALELEILP